VLRLVGFFLLVLVALQILRAIPFVGRLFDVPFLGFWGAAIIVSAIASRWTAKLVDRRRLQRQMRTLGAVETPHNQGKLGSLLYAAGNARAAIPPLERAVTGEPQSLEWRYRLGSAYLDARRPAEAVRELQHVAAGDEEYAYGAVLVRLARAHALAGEHEAALAVLERFERNHGPSPESACRRGSALRALGRKPEAAQAFASVARLARANPAYHKGESRGWVMKAQLARWF
jgi:hypothetical protein